MKIEKKIKFEQFLYFNLTDIKYDNTINNFKDDILLRISKRYYQISNFPKEIAITEGINILKNNYYKSFYRIYNKDDSNNLNDDILLLHQDETKVGNLIAGSLKDVKLKNPKISQLKLNKINESINNYFYDRINLGLLVGKYLENCNKGDYNVICTKLFPKDIINYTIDKINIIYSSNFNYFPNITIKDLSNKKIYHFPKYLDYIVYEILKNSIKSNITSGNNNIKITLLNKNDYIIIKISDKGIGIDPDEIGNIFNYSYTSSENNFYTRRYINSNKNLNGYGFGLSYSKTLINFFEGDIKVISRKNSGTDVYLYIKNIIY